MINHLETWLTPGTKKYPLHWKTPVWVWEKRKLFIIISQRQIIYFGKFPFFHWWMEIFLGEKKIWCIIVNVWFVCVCVSRAHVWDKYNHKYGVLCSKDGHAPMIHLSHSSNALHNINKWVSVEFSYILGDSLILISFCFKSEGGESH